MMMSPLSVRVVLEHDYENKLGPSLFGICFQATTNDIVSFGWLRFTYHSQGGPSPTVRVVDPYRMWQEEQIFECMGD